MPTNKPPHIHHLITLSLLLTCTSTLGSEFDKSIEDTLKFGQTDGRYGQIKADFNYRWENVNQDIGPQHTANANTIRAKLGYLSPELHGLQGYVEYAGNYVLQSDYNNGYGNKPGYSTVADPDRHEVNQFWLGYSGIPDTLVKGGRQSIELDGGRFIGAVPWRQLDQNFDAVLITNKSIPGLVMNVGYLGNVQTVISSTENINAPIINANYKLGNYSNLIGYGYWLDYTETDTYAKSNQTYGVRFNGTTPKFYDNYSLLYTAEYSYQQDYQHSITHYEADRINLMAGFKAYFLSFEGAMEQFNGYGPNKRFITPLGTNHAYQGWADLFLVTPDNGLRDVFGTVKADFDEQKLSLIASYHDFTDDTGGLNYGKEFDAQIVKKIGKHYALLGKYAYYDANRFGTDTQKIWLQANISF